MIKVESAHIEEMRGIRNLDIDFKRQVFAIHGPNGSGKSGVIDAIEFALTGQISRLSGAGTKSLTLSDHGPHVDKVKFPDAALVRLNIYLTDLKKSVTITRKIKSPGKLEIDPPDPDVRAALAEIASHPEITLSRREILRFILAAPTKRSEEIQALLKLDEIGQIRSALNTAQNTLGRTSKQAAGLMQANREALLTHLQSVDLSAKNVLHAANQRRELLGLSIIGELTADTRLDEELATTEPPKQFNKQSALRDIKAFNTALVAAPAKASENRSQLLDHIATLEADPDLLLLVQHRSFIEAGLAFVKEATCPLCDANWDSLGELREHLKAKLEKSKSALALQQALLNHSASIVQVAGQVSSSEATVHRLATDQGAAPLAAALKNWKEDLERFQAELGSVKGIMGQKGRLIGDWLRFPTALASEIAGLESSITALPDQSMTIDAQTFLTKAQDRLVAFRESRRRAEAAKLAEERGKRAYEVYCKAQEAELEQLYDEVQKDFSSYYSAINDDDEAEFTAKLTPAEGSLDFQVNFYNRGLFPPAAFHSEGHQDSMGVCLYLALMKRLFGTRFTFALLDDVVMSVDSGHRKQFCKLLKKEFPDTQFIITTHDRTWAEQMRFAGLITSKTSLAFHSWSIDGGPLVESNDDIWTVIAAELAKNRVSAAAATLRNHLEFVTRLLADQLAARPAFQASGSYDPGEMTTSVLSRISDLYGKAVTSAQSWENSQQKAAVVARQGLLKAAMGDLSVEQWAVNKALHYNEWAAFSREDFEPVVATYQRLLEHFRCQSCKAFVFIEPRYSAKSLRCDCNAINFNLMKKP
jgi:DNA repair exonuclease SbcCD ATPase subunit